MVEARASWPDRRQRSGIERQEREVGRYRDERWARQIVTKADRTIQGRLGPLPGSFLVRPASARTSPARCGSRRGRRQRAPRRAEAHPASGVTLYEPRAVVKGDATVAGSRKSAAGAAGASAKPDVLLP